MHCPGGNATDPIWRVLASSDRISSWTPLKPLHSNPIPNPLANQLWCIDFLTPSTHHPSQTPYLPWISYATQKLMLDSCKMVENSLKHSIRFCGIIFSKFKTEFYCISFFYSVPASRLHFWNSPAVTISRVYSNCCCSCWFEPQTIKIGQSYHNMYSNNIVKSQLSTTILNACTKKSGKLWRHHVILRG